MEAKFSGPDGLLLVLCILHTGRGISQSVTLLRFFYIFQDISVHYLAQLPIAVEYGYGQGAHQGRSRPRCTPWRLLSHLLG